MFISYVQRYTNCYQTHHRYVCCCSNTCNCTITTHVSFQHVCTTPSMQLQHMPGCFCVLFQHATFYSVHTCISSTSYSMAPLRCYLYMGSPSQSEYILYTYLHPLLRQDRLHVLYHDYQHPQLLTIQSAALVYIRTSYGDVRGHAFDSVVIEADQVPNMLKCIHCVVRGW